MQSLRQVRIEAGTQKEALTSLRKSFELPHSFPAWCHQPRAALPLTRVRDVMHVLRATCRLEPGWQIHYVEQRRV
jgi:hypothetical protein